LSKAFEIENTAPKASKTEMEVLRQRIMETIVYSKNFWLVYKFNTFGIAGFIDLKYKKSYLEILFYTPSQSKRLNGRLIRINSPLLKELNFRPIFEEPSIDKDGFIIPIEVFKRIMKLAENEIQAYKFILENQVKKLNEDIENYAINNNPYNREFLIHIDKFVFNFSINFELFPKRPLIMFSKDLRKIITEEEFLESPVMKNWSEENPVSIMYIIDQLMYELLKRKKISEWNSNSQQLIFNNVIISSEIPEINIKIHRGETLGIINSSKSIKTQKEASINEFFRLIIGTTKPIQGDIILFGKNTKNELEQYEKSIFIVSVTQDPKIENLNVWKALSKNILITTKHPAAKTKRKLKNMILEISGLKNKQNEIVNNLSIIERIKFGIARCLLQSPSIIMFSIPETALNRLQAQSFQLYLDKIKREFHTIIIVHGSKDIISNCDKIITISEEKVGAGSVEDLVLQIPQAGEIIEIELNNLNPDALNKQVLKSLFESAIIIEERQNEKFKIFSQENPDELVISLMKIIGPFLYNFKRFKPSLAEYLEFMEILTKK